MFEGFHPHWSTYRKLMWLYKGILKKGGAAWKTVSGSLIHITDAIAAPVSALSVAINPVQNLNGYDNPWPAGGGANKLPPYNADTKTLGTTTCTFDGNGKCTLKAVADSTARTFTFDITPFTTPTGTCYMHILNSAANNGVTMSFRDASDGAIGGSFAFSSSPNRIIALTEEQKGQVVSKIRVYKNAAQTDFELTFSPMLLETNAATTTYIPYSNICPISGWTEAKVTRTGKNLFEMTLADIKAANTDGTWTGDKYILYTLEFTFEQENGFVTAITANGTPTGHANLKLRSTTLPLIKGTSYKLNGCPSGGSVNSYGLWATQNGVTDYGSGRTFTADGTTVYNGRIRIVQGTECNDLTFRPMIQLSADDAAFAPYSGTTLTIDLDGTVYGGTLDVLTGTLTVTRKSYVFAGNEGWTINAQGNAVYVVSDMVKGNTTDGICDKLKTGTQAGDIRFGASENSNSVYIVSAGTVYGLDTVAKVQAFTAGMQICYRLATPLTVQLTPAQLSTLLGENNIWADTGDTTMTYMAQGG